MIFTVAVDDLSGWRIYRGGRIVDQSKHEMSLSTGRGTGHDGGERMNERHHSYIKTMMTLLFILELGDDFVKTLLLLLLLLLFMW